MQIKEFLENVCSEIKYKPIRSEISEELKLHIQELKEDYIANGMKQEEAEEKAVSNMGDATQIGKKLNKIHKPKMDFILIFLIGILIGFGFLISFIKIERATDSNVYLYNHIKYFSIGLILSTVIYFFDYRKILSYSNLLYIFSSIILIFSLIFGVRVQGMHSYVRGIYTIYFCIYLYVISFVGMIQQINEEKILNFNINKFEIRLKKDILKIILLSILSMTLLIILKESVMCLLLFISYMIMATIKIIKLKDNIKLNLAKLYGISAIFCIMLGSICIICKPYLYYHVNDILEYTIHNFNGETWTGKEIENVLSNSKLTSGLDDMEIYFGLFDGGTNNALITIIAYCGKLYAVIIVSSIILLCIKLILNCKKVKDEYGKLLIIGVSTIILLQAIINILMNLNIFPQISIGLPFISYGGNGLVVNMMSVALILSIYRRKDINFSVNKENKKKLKIKIVYE